MSIITTPARLARIEADLCPLCDDPAPVWPDGYKRCAGKHSHAPFRIDQGQITYLFDPEKSLKPAKKASKPKVSQQAAKA